MLEILEAIGDHWLSMKVTQSMMVISSVFSWV